MVTFTSKAISEFKKCLHGDKACGIRIFASAGCCSPSLVFVAAKGPEKGDATINQTGVMVFVEKVANNMMPRATIDYVDELGFIVTGMPYGSCCILGRI